MSRVGIPGPKPRIAAHNAQAGAPKMPSDLPEAARPYWRRLAKMLTSMRVLTHADGDMLRLLCLQLLIANEAAAAIAQDGVLRPDERGRMAKHPMLQVHREASAAARVLLVEFGLSPAARARVDLATNTESIADMMRNLGGGE